MTIKAQSDYTCPGCGLNWLPHRRELSCPKCSRAVADNEVTAILDEALESAKFNVRLYGIFALEIWTCRGLGDAYLQWGFTALQKAAAQPSANAHEIALSALMDLNLEEMSPYRGHVLNFLTELIIEYRRRTAANPVDWQKIPEPRNPYRGRGLPGS
jgi:hypothetical protein